MSLTVKAYLEIPGGEPEIRRFAVDPGVSSSYTYLSSKIPQVFSSLAGKQFDLFWKDDPEKYETEPLNCLKKRKRKADNSSIEDEMQNIKITKTESTFLESHKDVENDLIAFSSDDELTEALGFVNDGIFKIYIKPSNRGPTPGPSSNEGVVHPGVVCDGCEGSIQGTRYKCCRCPDYDLCAGCEANGLHMDHPMVRMTCPDQYMNPFPGFFGGPHQPPPPPPYGPPFGGPPGGHFPPGGPPGGSFPPAGPPPFGPFGPGGPFGRPGHCKPWRKMMKRCWRKYWRNMYDQEGQGCGADSDSELDSKDAKEPRKEKEHMQGEAGQAPKDGGGTKAEDGDSPTEEYLKDVGESVAAMLDPLGIDVAVDVECRGRRKKCHGGRGGGWGFGRGRGGGWGRWMFGPGFFGGGGAMGRGFSPADGSGPNWYGGPNPCNTEASQGSATAPQNEKSDVDMQENGQDQQQQKGKECSEPMSPLDVQMGSPSQSTEHSDGDWMLLNNQDKEQQHQTNPTTGNQPSNHPTAPIHPIPRIAQVLEQLKAMGFNDDGGWLTQLIEAKGGDLNKVLDALKPHHSNGQ